MKSNIHGKLNLCQKVFLCRQLNLRSSRWSRLIYPTSDLKFLFVYLLRSVCLLPIREQYEWTHKTLEGIERKIEWSSLSEIFASVLFPFPEMWFRFSWSHSIASNKWFIWLCRLVIWLCDVQGCKNIMDWSTVLAGCIFRLENRFSNKGQLSWKSSKVEMLTFQFWLLPPKKRKRMGAFFQIIY